MREDGKRETRLSGEPSGSSSRYRWGLAALQVTGAALVSAAVGAALAFGAIMIAAMAMGASGGSIVPVVVAGFAGSTVSGGMAVGTLMNLGLLTGAVMGAIGKGWEIADAGNDSRMFRSSKPGHWVSRSALFGGIVGFATGGPVGALLGAGLYAGHRWLANKLG